MKYFVQAQMEKGQQRHTAWIPEKFAVVGKVLKIKGDDGWLVVSIHSRKSEEEVRERSQDYKHQRKASDI